MRWAPLAAAVLAMAGCVPSGSIAPIPSVGSLSASDVVGRYKLSGTPALRPTVIADDGVHTYLQWGEEQELPAVFALGPIGEEEMVDGYVRGGVFTIDRVYSTLIFRIGKHAARADRWAR